MSLVRYVKCNLSEECFCILLVCYKYIIFIAEQFGIDNKCVFFIRRELSLVELVELIYIYIYI